MSRVMFQAGGTKCPKCGYPLLLSAKDDTGLLVGRCENCKAEFEMRPDEKNPRELKKA